MEWNFKDIFRNTRSTDFIFFRSEHNMLTTTDLVFILQMLLATVEHCEVIFFFNVKCSINNNNDVSMFINNVHNLQMAKTTPIIKNSYQSFQVSRWGVMKAAGLFRYLFICFFVCWTQTVPKCTVGPHESRRPFSPSQTCAWSKYGRCCIDAHERLSHQIAGSGPTLAAHTATDNGAVCLCLRLMLSAFSARQCLHNARPLSLCEDPRTRLSYVSTPTASSSQRAFVARDRRVHQITDVSSAKIAAAFAPCVVRRIWIVGGRVLLAKFSLGFLK